MKEKILLVSILLNCLIAATYAWHSSASARVTANEKPTIAQMRKEYIQGDFERTHYYSAFSWPDKAGSLEEKIARMEFVLKKHAPPLDDWQDWYFEDSPHWRTVADASFDLLGWYYVAGEFDKADRLLETLFTYYGDL
ncbi:MAG: hypothetical protein JEZ07_13060 [Phycisphaerae bacterium]|nr:hypothetical protein [Phycisphaerae bacterium]